MSGSAPGHHHIDCEWQFDQYPQECTCGLTAPKAPWFDAYVARTPSHPFVWPVPAAQGPHD